MPRTKTLLWILSGLLAGIALMLACGDDATGHADAAVDAPTDSSDATACDCTGLEPAISPGRIYRERRTRKPSAGLEIVTQDASCKAGDMVVGGGCYTFFNTVSRRLDEGPKPAGPDHVVLLSGPARAYDSAGALTAVAENWECAFRGDPARDDIFYEAVAICLDIKPD